MQRVRERIEQIKQKKAREEKAKGIPEDSQTDAQEEKRKAEHACLMKEKIEKIRMQTELAAAKNRKGKSGGN